MIWRPLNLAESCPANSNITACSNFGYIYLNLLVHLYGASPDYNYRSEQTNGIPEDLATYDFIVVGAGAAGCVLANRLTENDRWSVLLLEAGPEQPDVTLVPSLASALLGSNIDWQYKTEPNGKSCLARPEGRCNWPRGKMMGGSSSINSLAYVRGNKADYDGWSALGNPGWSYDEVLPFFKKSEKNLNIEGLDTEYHGVDGEQTVVRLPYADSTSNMIIEAFNERGVPILDFNADTQEGTLKAQTFSYNGERVSTNTAFIEPIRQIRDNLVVKTNAEVFKILIKDEIAYGVKYERNRKIYTAFARKEVIISGGTINSPKLLMLSGIGPKEHLEELGIPVIKDLPVGENLHDHVTFNGILVAVPNTATLVDHREILEQVEEYKYMEPKEGSIAGDGPVNCVTFVKTLPHLVAPDIQYQQGQTVLSEFINEPLTSEQISIFPTTLYNAISPRTMNLVPKSRGRILLNGTDPNGPPLIYPNYFDNDEDFLPILRGVRFVLSLESTEAYRRNGAHFVQTALKPCEHWEWGTDEYFICLMQAYTSTPYHPVGTCKMGPQSDPTSVVDSYLRVYGVGGLRVIDASIMPVVVRGNTNAPSIMIGERGADYVIQYWAHIDGAVM